MSRSFRHIRQYRAKAIWQRWFDGWITGTDWHMRPREFRREEEQNEPLRRGGRGFYNKYWRQMANRKDRHRIKAALRVGSLRHYQRRKHYPEPGW